MHHPTDRAVQTTAFVMLFLLSVLLGVGFLGGGGWGRRIFGMGY